MSSSNRNPLQDITNKLNLDPKEVKRQRDREYYEKNKDEISKRRRQARELKKKINLTTSLTDDNTVSHTPATGHSGVTQLQCKTVETGMSPSVQETYAAQFPQPHGSLNHISDVEPIVGCTNSLDQPGASTSRSVQETYASQTPQPHGSPNHVSDVELTVGCTNVSLDQPGASNSLSVENGSVTNVTNSHTNQFSQGNKQKRNGQSWYARLFDENKAEYLKRQRGARQQKKAATTNSVEYHAQAATQIHHTPLSNITMSHANDVCADADPEGTCASKPREGTPGIGEIGSVYSDITNNQGMQCSESAMLDEDCSDWLHSNLNCIPLVKSLEEMQSVSTSAGGHGLRSFVEKSAYSEKKRQRDSSEQKRQRERERYSKMTPAQKGTCLQNNRGYKKLIREQNSPMITSHCTPVLQTQPANINLTGDTNGDDESDPAGIFESVGQCTRLEDNLHTIQEDQTLDDEDEECRIFSGQGDVFDSWRVTNVVAPREQNDDPYDFVYHNLPKKHHVLKKVKDCEHCGAIRFQYEGPAFCCRKGKVKIVTPEVPSELRRLFTSQVDEDAKYFRKHIRYFNTHFSFTSLGVTLDQKVSTAAGTGNYTFRAQGALYYRMDDLVPGGQGPRHLQLYIYDTDETLEHRVKRSPDLDINIIRKILKILENNPYVQIFKSVGSVPNLAEYKISLNTDIRLDQRRYNAPTASQVAAMWVEGSDPANTFDRQVVVHGKGEKPIFIRAYYGCYDPLAYPLFFPGGETGWNRWLPYAKPASVIQENNEEATERDELHDLDDEENVDVEHHTGEVADDEEDQEDDEGGSSRKYVSAREYYCFKLQVRKKLFNIILFGARGFQQWAVDMYIKMETMRLDFYSKPKNQKLIRGKAQRTSCTGMSWRDEIVCYSFRWRRPCVGSIDPRGWHWCLVSRGGFVATDTIIYSPSPETRQRQHRTTHAPLLLLKAQCIKFYFASTLIEGCNVSCRQMLHPLYCLGAAIIYKFVLSNQQ